MTEVLVKYGDFEKVINFDEFPNESVKRLRFFGRDLLLVKDGGENLHLIENICPHAAQELTDAIVVKERIRCRRHGAVFNLENGQCIGSDQIRPIKKLPYSIENDRIIIEL